MCRIVTPGKVEHGDGKYIVRTFRKYISVQPFLRCFGETAHD